MIVTQTADLRPCLESLLFGAVGTAGQRCTTTRRLIVHESVKEPLLESLRAAYRQVRIGNPLNPDTLMGPMIDAEAVDAMGATLEELKTLGGRILYGGERLNGSELPRRALRYSLSGGSKERMAGGATRNFRTDSLYPALQRIRGSNRSPQCRATRSELGDFFHQPE